MRNPEANEGTRYSCYHCNYKVRSKQSLNPHNEAVHEVLNINVIAAIIKQDRKSYKNTQSELPIVNQTQNKFNQCEDENTYLSRIIIDLDLVYLDFVLTCFRIRYRRIFINSLATLVVQSGSVVWRGRTP